MYAGNGFLLGTPATAFFHATDSTLVGKVIVDRPTLAPHHLTMTLDGTTTWTGDITVGTGSFADLAMAGTATWTGAATNVRNISLGGDSTWTMNADSTATQLTLSGKGTWAGNGVLTGDVSNGGIVAPGTSPTPDGKLTVNGNYVGTGGTLAVDAFLGDNTNSKTDQLIVNDGSMKGTTHIHVIVDPTSPGGITDSSTNGIPIVVAEGTTTTDSKAFSLGKDVLGGAKYYVLLRGQNGSPQELNSWYLCSTSDCVNAGGQGGPGFIPPLGPPPFLPPGQPLYHGGTPIQSLYGTMARQLGLLTLGTFHDRNGDQRLADTGGRERGWARVFGEHMEQSHAGTVSPSFDGNFVGLQGGSDLWQFASLPGHRDNVGLFAAYTEGRANVSGLVIGIPNLFAGSTDFNATSLGGYWSHIAPTGWYTDTVLMGTLYDGDGRTRHATDVDVEGSGVILSFEGGFTLARFAGMKLEPQAQLVYQYINLDEAHHNNSAVDHHTPDALHGRIGLRLAADSLPWLLRPYLKANIWQDFVGSDRTTYGGVDELVLRHRATTLELGGGFTAQIAPNVALWASAEWSTDIGGNEQERESVSGNAGLRVTW